MAFASSEHALARTDVVKVLWDHATDLLYFCQSERWPLHYDFAVRFLQNDERVLGDRRTFNTRQYLRPDRQMQMASIVRYRDSDIWALELGPADNLSGAGVVALHTRIKTAVYFGDALRYKPRSELHRRRVRRVDLPIVQANDVWTGARYQAVTLGETAGRLRFVDGALDPASVLPDQILVLREVPADLPVCAGVITAELQAPLAHVAVLSQSRGTPNMALRDAFDSALKRLSDQWVRLRVGADDYVVERVGREVVEASLRSRRPAAVSPPVIDRARDVLTDTCDVRLADTSWAGAKAAQLGEVCAAGVETSGGFVIPAHFYFQHLERNAIDNAADTLRAAENFDANGQVRGRALGDLRRRIERAQVSESLIAAVQARLVSSESRFIFRSSTNAEDLPGFSGAGLYASVVTEANPSRSAIAQAITQVWSSVYTRRAWDERAWYRIHHDAVGMAILVQPFVDNVAAMGVAISLNPFSDRRTGILVNLAPPGGSVTAAEGEELPEQVLLYRHSRAEVLSRSTRNGGQRLLRERHMRPMRDVLDRVHDHMMSKWGERADAADIELALRRDGSVVILQARPYRRSARPR